MTLHNAPESTPAAHVLDPTICRGCGTRLFLIREGRDRCARCDPDAWQWAAHSVPES
jgi:hypothetical protein